MSELRKAFSKSFSLPDNLHCGKGDQGGCSIVSTDQSYVRMVVGEGEESRLIGFLRKFADEHNCEFSGSGR